MGDAACSCRWTAPWRWVQRRRSAADGLDPVALLVAGVFVTLGLAFKLGAVPGHPWVPDVAQGAPAPAAGLVTSAGKIAALVALARLVGLLPADMGWQPVIALLAAATMTLGNLAALWQDDVRRLLGWSAVSQTGYGLMAVVALGRSGLAEPALVVFVVAYAVANVTAFGVVSELRGRTRMEDYAGIAWQRPLLIMALAVAFLSLVGVPPLIGFPAKLALFGAAIEAGYGWLAALAVANTVVSLFYYLRVLGRAHFTDAADAEAAAPVPVLGRWAGLAAVVGAAAVVVLGVLVGPLLAFGAEASILPH